MTPPVSSVAVVHDYLTQRGGAERVVLSMVGAFPGAPVYTSLYEPRMCFPQYRDVGVHPSPLNALGPLRRRHRLAFPLLARSFDRRVVDAEVTLVSSSGWAHGVHTTGRKIVYCHAPARWLYQREHYLRQRGAAARVMLASMHRRLRAWDLAAARSADCYLVNSTVVRDQVRDAYGIDAEVVHPPHSIDVGGRQREVQGITPGYALCIARLQAYKNVDVVVHAMRQLPNVELVVVGTGPSRPHLEHIAGSNIRFVGEISDSRLRWLYANAGVLIAASHEDFGLTPVEAAAFGVPTVALRAGGYLDTVVDHTTGVCFDGLTSDQIAVATDKALATDWDRDVIVAHADRFNEDRFISRLRAIANS